ncbi:PKD domain-containing protein [bacterium]|nr:PKD domain-containing protein [bacterium]
MLNRIQSLSQRTLPILLLLIPILSDPSLPASERRTDVNFLVTAGRDASIASGDSLFRSVFFIRCPIGFESPVYVRIFDADAGGRFDQPSSGDSARYRVFGKGAIRRSIRSIHDALPDVKPLVDLEIGEDVLYDGQWRTLAVLRPEDGQEAESIREFQLIVDGAAGAGVNRYRLFVSSEDSRNTPVEGLVIASPVATVLIPASNVLVTRIPFRIPPAASGLKITVFDAEGMGECYIQTEKRLKIPVPVSGNMESRSTRVELLPEERGGNASLMFAGSHPRQDHVQCRIEDDSDETVEFFPPALHSTDNRLPSPIIDLQPLSDCESVVLDASSSSDPDGDQLFFEWKSAGEAIGAGPRIVHRFSGPGLYKVTLTVRDNSGFVADRRKLERDVRINQPPVSLPAAPSGGAPGEILVFDGSGSSDADGRITAWRWDFGDGAGASGAVARHAYAVPGHYRITLTVEDDSRSFCASDGRSVFVRINSPPAARLRVQSRAAVGEEVRADGGGSDDADGTLIRYAWDFGDGATAEGAGAGHRYTAPGVYRIRLAVTDDAGRINSTQTDSALVRINAPPEAKGSAPAVVAARQEALFDGSASRDPDGRIVAIEWDFGDGSPSASGPVVRHAYDQPGVYEAILRVRDDSGVSNDTDTLRISVRVNAPPVPDAGGDRVLNESVARFDASASSDTDDPIVLYRWDFGDGKSAEGLRQSHVYSLPGVYEVSLTVTDASGTASASQTDRIRVTVNHPPVADAGPARTVAPGEPVLLDGGFSSDPDGRIESFRWEIEPGIFREGRRVEVTFDQPGLRQPLLFVRDDAGAEDVFATEVRVNAPPVAVAAPVPAAAPGDTVVFDGSGSSDPDGRIAEAVWDFGDGTPPVSGLRSAHVYTEPGVFSAVLRIRDDSGAANGAASAVCAAAVNHAPEPDAGGDRSQCGLMVDFDGSGSRDADGDGLSLRWDFGDSTSAFGRRIRHRYPKPGLYPVRLIVDDGTGLTNGRAETFIKVHLRSAPVAVLDAPGQACAGENVLFDASRSLDEDRDLLLFEWDFGDGSKGEGATAEHTFRAGGLYRVLVTVRDNSGLPCNASTAAAVIRVTDAPVAQAGPDQTVCANQSVVFDGSACDGGSRPIQGYEWDFGDGGQGGGVHAAHAYTRPGLYTVRLRITVPAEGNCENFSEDEMTVRVLPSPVASFEADRVVCPGADVVFDADPADPDSARTGRYEWDFGDGVTGSGLRMTHCFVNAGTFTVRLTVTMDGEEGCRTAAAERTIIVNERPEAGIETGRAGRSGPGEAVRFTAFQSRDGDGLIRSYAWDFGDGEKAEGIEAVHRYRSPGVFRAVLRVEDDSGSECGTDTASVTVRVEKPGDVWTPEGPAALAVGEPGIFSVPESHASGETVWTFGDGDTLTGPRVTKSFRAPGTWQVQAGDSGSWSRSLAVRVVSAPQVTAPERMDADVRVGAEFRASVSGRDLVLPAVVWDFGDGRTLESNPAVHAYERPGTFTASVTVRDARDPAVPAAVRTMIVTVHPAPEARIEIQPDTLYAGGGRDEASFLAVPADPDVPIAAQWDFGDGRSGRGGRVLHAYTRPGAYTVRLTVRNTRRPASAPVTVEKQIRVLPR